MTSVQENTDLGKIQTPDRILEPRISNNTLQKSKKAQKATGSRKGTTVRTADSDCRMYGHGESAHGLQWENLGIFF